MSAVILDGSVMSEVLRKEITGNVESLKMAGIVPGLAVILVGNDPASAIYVRNKEKACREVGIYSETVTLPKETTQQALEAEIDRLTNDPHIHGILVQLPLPSHLDETSALMRIPPEKDVDGFHFLNTGKLMSGKPDVIPCTPRGALYMIRQTGLCLSGLEAVVVGRSNIVVKPMAALLLSENCTVTICHSRTKNLAEHTRKAEILVSAVGKPGFKIGRAHV